MSKLRKIFAENVRARIGELGISQAEAARRVGIGQPQLNDYLTGKKSPGLDVLERIAEGLKTTAARLLGGEGGAISHVEHDLTECVRRVSAAARGRPVLSPKPEDFDLTRKDFLAQIEACETWEDLEKLGFRRIAPEKKSGTED